MNNSYESTEFNRFNRVKIIVHGVEVRPDASSCDSYYINHNRPKSEQSAISCKSNDTLDAREKKFVPIQSNIQISPIEIIEDNSAVDRMMFNLRLMRNNVQPAVQYDDDGHDERDDDCECNEIMYNSDQDWDN